LDPLQPKGKTVIKSRVEPPTRRQDVFTAKTMHITSHYSVIQIATALGCKPTTLDSGHKIRIRCFESGLGYLYCFLNTNAILPHVHHTRFPVSRSVLPTCLVGRKGSRRTAARIHVSVGDPSDISPTAFPSATFHSV
jgi:hypothetical protein